MALRHWRAVSVPQMCSIFSRRTFSSCCSRYFVCTGTGRHTSIPANRLRFHPSRKHGVVSNLCIKAEDANLFAKLKKNTEIEAIQDGPRIQIAKQISDENISPDNDSASTYYELNTTGLSEDESSSENGNTELNSLCGVTLNPYDPQAFESNSHLLHDSSDDTLEDNSDIIHTAVNDNYPEVPLDRTFILPSNWRFMTHAKGIKFPGEVIVIQDSADEVNYQDILQEFAASDVLGFDSEHCSSHGMVCVIQLATEEKAVLWQCYNTTLPPGLKALLTGQVFKTGHACLQDAVMIANQFKVHSRNLIDTCRWAKDLRCMPRSLQAMCGIFLGEYLSKKHQRSNWKIDELTHSQIRYAATDAWVSLRVYQEMKKHGERLNIKLTPCYRTLQQYAAEIQEGRRKKRLRYRQRRKERETSSEELSDASHIDHDDTDHRRMHYYGVEALCSSKSSGTVKPCGTIHSNDEPNGELKELRGINKQSSGSRKRSRKFNAKFHVLE